MKARYDQKLGRVRKWLHSDALWGAGGELTFSYVLVSLLHSARRTALNLSPRLRSVAELPCKI